MDEDPPPADDAAVYVIERTPGGEAACRLAGAGERESLSTGERVPVRQINHLRDKKSAAASASAGLIIVLRGTSQLEANPQAKQAFINAAAKWEALVSTQITVTIDVDYGTTFFGQPYSSVNTLGATGGTMYSFSYASVRQRLLERAPPGSEEAALLNSLPAASLPTDIGNVSNILLTVPLLRALGYPENDLGGNPRPAPRIGFNSNFSFDFNPDDGVNPTQTDFDSVAVHEIGHALGFFSMVGSRELRPTEPLFATVWDFYRFRPSAGPTANFLLAQRALTSGVDANDLHVHFSGGAQIELATGKPDGTGGDARQASHWKDDSFGVPTIGIMDPTIPPGRHDTISESDLKAIDLFGYSVASPFTTPPAPPPNDDFANAQQLSGTSARVTGTNVGATKEAGEPSHAPDGDPGGKSVWYVWTAPSSGTFTFSTGQSAQGAGSNFDTVLAAYTGSDVGALTPVAKNDDAAGGGTSSSIAFNAVGGTTYRIAVDGWNGGAGTIALSWSFGGTPITGCASAPITINGGAANGTLSSDDCRSPVDNSFYDAYTFTGAAGQLVTIEMDSTAFDTYLYLLRPGETALSYRTIQNDDTGTGLNSRIVAVLPGSGTYTILANSAFSGATGAYTLRVTSVGNCTASNLGSGTGTFTPPNPSLGSGDCRLPDGSYLDVYAFTATAGRQVSVEMSSSAVDPFLFLLSTDGFTELAQNDDGLTGGTSISDRGARIPAPPGGQGQGLATLPATGTYYILANSFSANEVGNYTLTLTVGQNCPTQSVVAGQPTAGQQLTAGDCRLPFDGSFIDVYTFEGTAGQQVSVSMAASFNAWLLLYDPAGFLFDETDPEQGGVSTSARLPNPSVGGFLTLPVTGTYRIYANAAAAGLTGAYQLSVTTPSSCTVTLVQTSRQNVPAGGGSFTESFTVPAGCHPPITSDATFISNVGATINQQGHGALLYTVAPNTTPQSRSGTISVGGKPFVVTQLAPAFSISGRVIRGADNQPLGGVTVTLGGTTSAAASTDITGAYRFENLTAGGTYTVTPSHPNFTFTPAPPTFNNLSADQSADFTAASVPALIHLSAQTYTVGEGGGAVAVTVTRTVNPSTAVGVSYSTSSGTAVAGSDYTEASGVISFAADEVTKTVTVPILDDDAVEGDETFTVTLSDPTGVATLGPPVSATITIVENDTCFYRLSQAARTSPAGGEGFTVNVTAPTGCAWTAASDSDFVAINSGAAGNGSGAVTVTVAANASSLLRSGTLTVAGQTFTVTQAGVPCTYTVAPPALDEFPAAGGQGSFQMITPQGCAWSVGSLAQWITINSGASGSGTGTVGFTVAANAGAARAGQILRSDGSSVTVSQAAAPATFRLESATLNVSEGDGRAEVRVVRAGDPTAAASVTFQTVDDPEAVPCAALNGKAYARCDYATTVEKLTWAAGDVQPKTVSIPLIDDGRAEGAETLQIRLSGPQAGAIGDIGAATLTIIDNDTAEGANPISGNAFFVRMQYLDFLSREPEAGEPWTGVLARCPNVFNTDPASPSAGCDRLIVSQSFFQSPEFQL
ncbi:MAG TPA: NF038122 family metalloprotease, partial [Pyrinomonadaceae bacterium]|nr:NF038122 family metalloprotease [Pyrinomonadaceae bacterium]